MKHCLTKITRITVAATALLAVRMVAQDLDSPLDGPLRVGPAPVQPVTQPMVGETPYVNVVNTPGSSNLQETPGTKEIVPSERHWKFLLGFTMGADYDDNIFLTKDHKEGDFSFAFAPTVGMQFGDPSTGANFLTFTYTPTFVVYADHSDENAVEHAVDIRFDHQSDIWRLSGNFDFLALSGGDNALQSAGGIAGEHIGERVDRQIYTLGLDYNYSVSDKTTIDVGFSGTYVNYQDFLDTTNLVNTDYLDYAVTGKTKIGLGLGLGYMNTEGSPDQYYEQALARVRYDATSKVTFDLHGGAEFVQTNGGGDQVAGIFGATASYALSDRTSFTLAGYRNVNPSSAEGGTNYTVTGVSLAASEKILGKLTLSVQVGYENSEYHTYSGVGVDRTDNYFFVQPSVQYQLGHAGRIELFYQYRNNNSSLDQFEFADNRVGLKFSVGF